MRDFFWFAVLTFAMVAVADYQTTSVTVVVATSSDLPAVTAVQETTKSDFAFLLNSAAVGEP